MSDLKLGKPTEYKFEYDPTLLDVFPRLQGRRDFPTTKMSGVDVWTCYEFSFLFPSGKPYSGVIRIINPVDSESIFESKSLKLYLNSFNNTVFEDVRQALEVIRIDLSNRVVGKIKVQEITHISKSRVSPRQSLDNLNIQTDIYDYTPDLLKGVGVNKLTTQVFYSDLLRSNCPRTHQPDWARVTIIQSSFSKLDKKSLLKYIISFRNHQGFHEIVCEQIYNDLFQRLYQLYTLVVLCQYTRRGGIDINPYRSNNDYVNYSMFTKLLQQ